LYAVNIDTAKDFPTKTSLPFVDLDTFTRTVVGKEPTDKNGFHDYKLFFEHSKESNDGEAEIFLNVNKVDKIVELREKDKEYRKAIIGFLSN
jgi:hypothetical protein